MAGGCAGGGGLEHTVGADTQFVKIRSRQGLVEGSVQEGNTAHKNLEIHHHIGRHIAQLQTDLGSSNYNLFFGESFR